MPPVGSADGGGELGGAVEVTAAGASVAVVGVTVGDGERRVGVGRCVNTNVIRGAGELW